jgi:hypothetical protein
MFNLISHKMTNNVTTYRFMPLEKLSLAFESTGLIDNEITGSGMCIDSFFFPKIK